MSGNLERRTEKFLDIKHIRGLLYQRDILKGGHTHIHTHTITVAIFLGFFVFKNVIRQHKYNLWHKSTDVASLTIGTNLIMLFRKLENVESCFPEMEHIFCYRYKSQAQPSNCVIQFQPPCSSPLQGPCWAQWYLVQIQIPCSSRFKEHTLTQMRLRSCVRNLCTRLLNPIKRKTSLDIKHLIVRDCAELEKKMWGLEFLNYREGADINEEF